MLTETRLKEKIDEVIEIFPWYKNLITSKNISSITDLPLMTSDILERYYYPAPLPGAAGIYETSKTSANKRKIISYSARDEELYLEIKKKRFSGFISGRDIYKVFIDVGIGHVCSTSGKIFDSLGLENITIDINLPLEEHMRLIKEFEPHILYMPPSLIDRVLAVTPDPISLGIRKIILIGEVITENWLKKTARAFGIKTSDFHFAYGSTETGTIATFSHKLNKYILSDGVYAEALKPEEIDSSLGPLAEDEHLIVITTFNRQFFPGLRFVTYDVVRGFEKISIKGETKQAFHSIPRRVGTEYKHGERISIHDIENVVYRYLDKAIIEARIKDNCLSIGLLSKELTNSVLEKIRNEIQSAVPEIGTMIKNGLLNSIRVEGLDKKSIAGTGSAKKKKIAFS